MRKPNFFFVVQPTIQRGTDLRGKLIGIQGFGGNSHQSAQLYVSHFDSTPPATFSSCFRAGEEPGAARADATGPASTPPATPPYPAMAERDGMRVLGTPDDLQVEIPFTGVGTSVEKIATQRDEVKRAVAAQLAAVRAIQSEREAVIRVMVDRLALDPELAASTYEQVRGAWNTEGTVSREGIDTLQRLDIEAGRAGRRRALRADRGCLRAGG